MKNVCLRFCYKHLYLIWGAVTAVMVTLVTGAALSSIIGATVGISSVTLVGRLLR